MQGLNTARAQGWISNETAMQLLFQFCNKEIDVHEEMARIAAEPPPTPRPPSTPDVHAPNVEDPPTRSRSGQARRNGRCQTSVQREEGSR